MATRLRSDINGAALEEKPFLHECVYCRAMFHPEYDDQDTCTDCNLQSHVCIGCNEFMDNPPDCQNTECELSDNYTLHAGDLCPLCHNGEFITYDGNRLHVSIVQIDN